MSNSNAIENLPRVAAIATLASRVETFQKVLPIICAQVDHVFIYLDGYSAPPHFLQRYDRLTVHRAELHASSRFLCLEELSAPTVVAIVDDDIIYPQDYVSRLIRVLQRFDGKAIVGVHGRTFLPPHQSYTQDVMTFHFTHGLEPGCHVHELGAGTCAFTSSNFDVKPRQWDRTDMDDILVATEAQRRGLPRIAIARPAGWLQSYTEDQSDSLWANTLIDNSEQSCRMRTLLSLYI